MEVESVLICRYNLRDANHAFFISFQQQSNENRMHQLIKDRLMRRQAKRKSRQPPIGENLSDAEKELIKQALEAEKQADKGDEVAAILAVVGELSGVETQRGERRLLEQLVDANNLSEDEKNALVSQLMEKQRETEKIYNERRDYADAALRAKLEARRKLRDEKSKEEAMRREMDALSGNRVSSVFTIKPLLRVLSLCVPLWQDASQEVKKDFEGSHIKFPSKCFNERTWSIHPPVPNKCGPSYSF